MSRQAERIGQLLKQWHQRLQDPVHIGFWQLASHAEHRAILRVRNLNQQPVVGEVQQDI